MERRVTDIPVIDLFAGAGGLSLGASSAGSDVRLMVDLDARACATLRLNPRHHPGTVLEADISALSGADLRYLAGLSQSDCVILVGGPPCQPFSKAAYWLEPGAEARYRRARARGQTARRPPPPRSPRPDPQRFLVYEFWRCLSELRADGFLFENVPSILHPRNRHVVERLVRSARGAGYHVRVLRANAASFGVPQRRERVFVLGARSRRPDSPEPTHAAKGQTIGLRPPKSAGKALARYAAARFFEPEEVVSGRWAQHLRTVPPGWNYKAHTAWANHPRPTFEAETRFWNFLLKLSPDLPSWTIPAHPGPWTGPFHWDDRRLRTPELAALQAFPHGYRFDGGRRERVRQIGNAVPPPLAAQMISQVIHALEGTRRSARKGSRT
jgi:DNA (cytosine-5)-methyltransferase 1